VREKFSGSMITVAIAAVVSGAITRTSAQAPAPSATVPIRASAVKTPWGEPDLQGAPRSGGSRLATARPRQRREQPETVLRSAGARLSAERVVLVEGLRLAPPPCDTSARSNVRALASQSQVR
jgi:hypothetical protein